MVTTPSLRSLRAFVEVARTGSRSGAAERLGVTSSAVSHILAELEGQVGQPLFADRRRSTLNEAGRRFADRLAPAFQAIDAAVADLLKPRSMIRLSTISTFALLWLIPRLPRLRARLPAVDILISTDIRTVDLAVEPYDCVIRWGRDDSDWRGLEPCLLFRERLIVVASPHLHRSHDTLPLLAARSRPDDWRYFADQPDIPSPQGAMTTFETRSQMIEAAVAGLGMAVIDCRLVEGTLAAGHLVQIGSMAEDRPEGYFLAARPVAFERRDLRTLRAWAIAEAEMAPGLEHVK